MVVEMEMVNGERYYEVVDKAHMRVYHVDLNDSDQPCDCHYTKWEKMPCIHVMRVLHWLQEYWRVWAFAGDEYRQEMVQLTCRDLNESEKELLLWLPKMESVELDEEEMAPIVRSYKTNNGINRKRYHSVGEGQVCEEAANYEVCCLFQIE